MNIFALLSSILFAAAVSFTAAFAWHFAQDFFTKYYEEMWFACMDKLIDMVKAVVNDEDEEGEEEDE